MTPNQRPGVGWRPRCASAAWTRSEGTWAPGDTWPLVARSHTHTHTCCRRYFRHPLLSRLEKVSCCKAKSAASPGSRLPCEPSGQVTRSSWLGERPRPASWGPGSCWGGHFRLRGAPLGTLVRSAAAQMGQCPSLETECGTAPSSSSTHRPAQMSGPFDGKSRVTRSRMAARTGR